MCGLAGLIRYDGHAPAQGERVLAMRERQRHRGPDGRGLTHDHAAPSVLALSNDADPRVYALEIATATRVDLHFPSFTDGRAYSQAYYLRRRLGFKGDLRATGEVLVDQLQQMKRMGFSSAVLREGSDSEAARRQLERFAAFYQGDVARAAPCRENDVDR